MKDILDKLIEIRESQIRIEDDLRYHIKRTDLLEGKLDEELEEIKEELKPIHKAYLGVKFSVGAIITLGALAAAIAKLKGYI